MNYDKLADAAIEYYAADIDTATAHRCRSEQIALLHYFDIENDTIDYDLLADRVQLILYGKIKRNDKTE